MHDAANDHSNPLDSEALSSLRRSGSHLGQAHLTEFYLYFPRQEQAEEVVPRLIDRDYRAAVESCPVSGRWLVLASKLILLTAENLASARLELSAIADAEGGIYDGWATRLLHLQTVSEGTG